MPAATDLVRAAEPLRTCRSVEWKSWPFPNNSLVGHATVSYAGWTRIPGFKRGDGSLSVGMPSTAEADAEGRIRVGYDGKKTYTNLVAFETKEAETRCERLIAAALDAARAGEGDGAP